MKIAVITDCLSRNAGGLFDGVRRLSQEMQTLGNCILVYGIADSCTNSDVHAWEPIRPYVVQALGPRTFNYAPGLVEAVVRDRPDVINTHGLWKYTSYAGLKCGRIAHVPYMVHAHGMLDSWAIRNSTWKKRLAGWGYERKHLREANCLRALNDMEAAAIRAFGLRNPVCVIPNGIDLPSPSAVSGPLQNPFMTDRKVLLYLGRIHPKKGLVNLLRAWSTCQGRRDWVLAIAGWNQGGHEAELKAIVDKLSLHDSVSFLGPRFGADKEACYHYSSAFVLPSFSEGLPMVILEAWAYGKPVLMTPQCNLPEGYAAEAAVPIDASPHGIEAGLLTLVNLCDAERDAMGRSGRRLVESRFSWKTIAQDVSDVCRWTLGGGATPAVVRC